MNNSNENKQQIFLGIDGGGSKCRAILYTEQNGVLAEAVSGPANVLRGPEKAQKHIIEATDEALGKIGLSPDYKENLIAGIGLAGLNLESCMFEMRRWQHPFKQAFFTTDLHIACVGAHGGEDGAVMIIGTGSSALLSQGDQLKELGGHGFPVGDAGSGAWLGFKTIELTLRAMDNVEQQTDFTNAVMEQYKVTSAIGLAQLVSGFTPTDFGKLAPLVVQYAKLKNPQALAIIQSGAAYLSSLATELLKGTNLKLSLIGGLSPLMQEYLSAEVAAQLTPAAKPPEIGAVLYAIQHAE
jgi:glucosamine kinase